MKNRFVAAFIALTLGTFGINEFYVNDKTRGLIDVLVSVLLCWTVVAPIIITIINFIRAYEYIWCNSDYEFAMRYVKGFKDDINSQPQNLND